MKEGWTYKKLVDECSILYGYPFDSKCFSTSPDDMPLIRIRDVKEGKTSTFYNGDYPKDYIIHKGDYLIGMDGEFNISPWQSEDALLNQRVCKISCNTSSLLIRYVYRFLIKELKKIEDETPFVTVKHLSAKKINQINIPVPPIAEQERIVAELDLLSGIIEKKKEQLKAYDQLAQSIFYSMFGDPIDNPKGWETKKLSENVHEMFLGPFGSALKVDSYVPKEESYCMVYEQKHAIQATINLDNHYINKEKFESLQRFEVKPHDFIMSCRGTIGKLYQIPNNAPKGIIHPSLMKIRIKEEFYNSAFFQFLLVKIVANESTNGNCVQMAITAKELGKKELPVPPLSLQEEFAEKIEAIEKQKALVKASIAETETLFSSRMDYYFG